MTAGDVLDKVASLMNDNSKQLYTHTACLPYLNMAMDELQTHMELENVPYTNEVSTPLVITAGVTTISSSTSPALPFDLVDIQSIAERANGSSDNYIPLVHLEFLSNNIQQTESLLYYQWANQKLNFLGATTDRQILIRYVGSALANVVTDTDVINLINSKPYLTYKTAALCASYIGENESRAQSLEIRAQAALDQFLGINAKSRQNIVVRRRPFMQRYNSRGIG